jgi:hypothetical protein
MLPLQKLYLFHTRKDLVSKFNYYKNINQVSRIKLLSLTFFKLTEKSLALLGLGFFFLINNKRGFISLSSSEKFLKKSFNSSLKLKDEEIFIFLEKFLKICLITIIDFEGGFSKKSFSTTGTFSFNLKDTYAFLELGEVLFKFRNLNNLNITFDFNRNNTIENMGLLKSLGFNFVL